MAREFRLPDIGEGLTEAEIVRWLVAEGDHVAADQPLVEVETDKAVVEIPSPYAGVVLSHGGAEGDVIDVGEVLVTIGEPGEAVDRPEPVHEAEGVAEPDTFLEAPVQESPREAAPIVGTLSDDAETLAPQTIEEPVLPSAIKALPVVRKLARDNEVDLEAIAGSGPGGRIMREDVEGVIAARAKPQPDDEPEIRPPEPSELQEHAIHDVAVGAGHGVSDEQEIRPPEPSELQEHAIHDVAVGAGHGVSDEHLGAPPAAEHAPTSGEDVRQPMSRLRRTIAANMARSWAEIPHVTTFDDVDATRLLEVRRALGERHGAKIPVEALVIKAVLPALDQYPEFNSSIDGDDLIFRATKDIGIAVDTPDGLLVAVIEDADEKSVMELAGEVRRLGEGARERSLTPGELTGQTFTVSNIGAVGGGHGTPIVPYGTVAILSVGVARLRPVVYEEDLAIAPVMPLSLSYDHRVVDGASGRRFMALVLENLEEPALFLAG